MQEPRRWCDPEAVDLAQEARRASIKAITPEGDRGIEAHWSLRAGTGWMASLEPWIDPEFLLSVQGGVQWHLINHWNRPRLNTALHLETSIHQHNRLTLALRAHIGAGDPWGLVSLGPVLKGGALFGERVRPQGYFLSYGLAAELLEGALVLEANRVRFYDGEQTWQVMAHTDVLTLGRDVFNVIDRQF